MESSISILNRPHERKRGLTINRKTGRIFLRSCPCRLLNLHHGDKIYFVYYEDHQMYLFKGGDFPDGITLFGRVGQLHGNSINTVRHLSTLIHDVPPHTTEIDLVVANQITNINIDNQIFSALAVINRADVYHCR